MTGGMIARAGPHASLWKGAAQTASKTPNLCDRVNTQEKPSPTLPLHSE